MCSLNTACALDALRLLKKHFRPSFSSHIDSVVTSGGKNKRLLGLESEIEVRTKETLTLEVKVTYDAVLVIVTEILNYEC